MKAYGSKKIHELCSHGCCSLDGETRCSGYAPKVTVRRALKKRIRQAERREVAELVND